MYTEEIKKQYDAIIADFKQPVPLRRRAFLEDMIAYFSEDPIRRCTGTSGCFYHPSTLGLEGVSEGCAIGRKLNPDIALALDDFDDGLKASKISDEDLGILQGLDPNFLDACQHLHDINEFWHRDKPGLTVAGKRKLITIKRNWL